MLENAVFLSKKGQMAQRFIPEKEGHFATSDVTQECVIITNAFRPDERRGSLKLEKRTSKKLSFFLLARKNQTEKIYSFSK